jgi:hypothetical protein
MRRQCYQHNRSNVSFLVMTLSVRDIVVGIRLLVTFTFGFPMMSPLMSRILSSLTPTPLMNLLIFLAWFSLHPSLTLHCLLYHHRPLHHYLLYHHYLLPHLLLHHHLHILPFSITILIVRVLHHLLPLLPLCLMRLHASLSPFMSLPPIEMLLLILSG